MLTLLFPFSLACLFPITRRMKVRVSLSRVTRALPIPDSDFTRVSFSSFFFFLTTPMIRPNAILYPRMRNNFHVPVRFSSKCAERKVETERKHRSTLRRVCAISASAGDSAALAMASRVDEQHKRNMCRESN